MINFIKGYYFGYFAIGDFAINIKFGVSNDESCIFLESGRKNVQAFNTCHNLLYNLVEPLVAV